MLGRAGSCGGKASHCTSTHPAQASMIVALGWQWAKAGMGRAAGQGRATAQGPASALAPSAGGSPCHWAINVSPSPMPRRFIAIKVVQASLLMIADGDSMERGWRGSEWLRARLATSPPPAYEACFSSGHLPAASCHPAPAACLSERWGGGNHSASSTGDRGRRSDPIEMRGVHPSPYAACDCR